MNAVNWQLGNKYGYKLERFTLSADGELAENSKLILTPTPLKPLTPAEFLQLSETSDEIATLGELLYGEGPESSYSADDLAGILARNNDLENRFGIAMLMCDLSLGIAERICPAICQHVHDVYFTACRPAHGVDALAQQPQCGPCAIRWGASRHTIFP